MKRKKPVVITVAKVIFNLIGVAANVLALATFFGFVESPSDLFVITPSAQTKQTVYTFLTGFSLFYLLLIVSVSVLRLVEGKKAYPWYHQGSRRPGSLIMWVLGFHFLAVPTYILYAPMLKVILPPKYQTNWALLGIFACTSFMLLIIGYSVRWYYAGLARERAQTPDW